MAFSVLWDVTEQPTSVAMRFTSVHLLFPETKLWVMPVGGGNGTEVKAKEG